MLVFSSAMLYAIHMVCRNVKHNDLSFSSITHSQCKRYPRGRRNCRNRHLERGASPGNLNLMARHLERGASPGNLNLMACRIDQRSAIITIASVRASESDPPK